MLDFPTFYSPTIIILTKYSSCKASIDCADYILFKYKFFCKKNLFFFFLFIYLLLNILIYILIN